MPRPSVLVYSTAVLERPVEVTGPIELRLFVASSARDTDFTGKLVDVFPDGRTMILTEGILRARYRDSFTAPELLQPDAVCELRLDLWATAFAWRSRAATSRASPATATRAGKSRANC